MPFYIAYADSSGAKNAATEVELSPRPTSVEYPPEPTGSRIETAGGSVVVQQLTGDPRIRSWIWRGYRAYMPEYQTLWGLIEPLRSRYRKLAGDVTPYVYLKEDETTLLRNIAVSGTTVTPTYGWYRCRIVEVSRTPRQEGTTIVTFDTIKLAFVIEDPSWNDWG